MKPQINLEVDRVSKVYDDLCAQIWSGSKDVDRLRRQARRLADVILTMEAKT